jgi:ABC-type oligopeptide transport system ATPase subunit
MSFLKVEDLISGYKEGFKLNNVSFSIEKTNFCGIIGPNGSGKSTLLKTIAGILMPENGKILLNNEDINSMDTKIRSQKIAYVGQFIENKELKVFDYVIMGRLPYFKSLQVFETKEDIEIVNYYKISSEDILVIYDDLDLEFGNVKISFKKGSGGHNGINSVIKYIGKEFYRLRVGIKNENYKIIPKKEFVLSKFSKEELKYIRENLYPDLEMVIEKFVYNNIVKAMNLLNRR